MEIEDNTSLIKKDASFIQKVGNQIFITNKLLQSKTSKKLEIINKEVKIGSQIWMTQNLNLERYRNGDIIPQITDPKEWENVNTGAWCYYNNNSTNGDKYGKLYNWFAVNDERGLAPEGWHIASDKEWTILSDYLEGNEVAGLKMKFTSGWQKYEDKIGDGTNESGFSGIPGGMRITDGDFYWIGRTGYWWCSTEEDSKNAFYRILLHENDICWRVRTKKNCGFSVRCVKD